MRNRYMLIGVVGIVVGVLLSSVVFVLAGNPDSPGAPGATNSFTLDDIYNRLDTGAAGTQSTFTEPGVAPGTGTMHTLNEIYDLIGDGGGAGVPKTGQTTTYATGDDGDLEKGVAWPSPRFTDNGDGTVTDNLTGLIWLQNANCWGDMVWANALTNANGLASGGCNLTDGSSAGDWRLPNVRELYSLIHSGQANSATWLSGQGFSGVRSNVYWSSTTYAGYTGYAWLVGLNYGFVDFDNKTSNYYVWPVRGGQ